MIHEPYNVKSLFVLRAVQNTLYNFRMSNLVVRNVTDEGLESYKATYIWIVCILLVLHRLEIWEITKQVQEQPHGQWPLSLTAALLPYSGLYPYPFPKPSDSLRRYIRRKTRNR